ncbi:DNA double-strand break repair nuclease NurA [Halopiger aswanensis]|uniref:NurA domain-containing protein n=1 Tax=Halopiger aswanensis TaxID=148449 RepID=A0A419WJU4_9EURY|nr:DNA double-strand break repair nuclease NurA [Halopiger aswanensis]RKD95642.1 NurA domain-containing protein [Halopiger aswanensis]
MPLYRKHVAQDLENKRSEFEGKSVQDEVIEEYRQAATSATTDYTKTEIEEELADYTLPGALPTEELNEQDGLIVPFEDSKDWESHEAVNDWARSHLENTTTIAADGSQIDPVTEFEQPVALVQAVWMANNHTIDGDYQRGVETEVLTPEDLLYEDPESGHILIDDEETSLTRFESEMEVLANRIEEHSEDETPPVVMYDGPLILSFAQMFNDSTQKRYIESLAKVLAASKHHKVPVVGYTAGSKASDLAKMLESLELADTNVTLRDYQVLNEFMENWGDRSIIFNSRRDNSLNWLTATYRGESYDFSEDILFTYLNIGPGPQMDRVDFPRWIYREGLVDHVLSALRAECGIGRGYPEILQAVDADAVISKQEREEFLRMFQDFSNEHNIDIKWDSKALSKKRRRR